MILARALSILLILFQGPALGNKKIIHLVNMHHHKPGDAAIKLSLILMSMAEFWNNRPGLTLGVKVKVDVIA